MGMYDTITFKCPECGTKIEVTSKSGICDLKQYKAKKVPTEIALDIEGKIIHCEICKNSLEIEGLIFAYSPMRLIRK